MTGHAPIANHRDLNQEESGTKQLAAIFYRTYVNNSEIVQDVFLTKK